MSQSKYKILYMTNIPSPYMVGYLNELSKYVDLNVVFEKGYDSSRPESWKDDLNTSSFQYTILDGTGISARLYGDRVGSAPDDKAFSPNVIKYISKKYDLIIVANPCTPTGIVEIMYLKLMQIPYTIQSEGGIPGTGKGFKERLKYFLMHKADYFFSTCELDDEYFLKYGASLDRIKRYPFASISQINLPAIMPSEEQKNKMKQELGITTKWFILTVGRSVPVKGFDVLLEAIPQIRNDDMTVGFVGGKCIREYQDIIDKKQIGNVFFQENVEFEKLKLFYEAADIFVLPTRSDTWGLVINEAMTFGLPVITTNMCVAGDALISEDVNGYIVPINDSKAIADKVNYLLEYPDKIIEMGDVNFRKMRKWTYEEMGKVMDKHIRDIVQ